MATAAPFVKLLRQLSSARDEYRSGALDLSWDGGKSSLYLVFGQPNHATYSNASEQELEGPAALTALLNNLPRRFDVAPWRKTVTRDGTLTMSLDELMEPFAQLAGASVAAEPEEPEPSVAATIDVGTAYQVEFNFGLEDFPLMPAGQSMFSDAAMKVVHLDLLLPKLPPSLIVVTGPKLRAAAVVVGGQLIDAVWVDDQAKAAGEGAAMAIMGATEGTVSGYRLADGRIAEAITMLWRCPERYSNLSLDWLDADKFLNSLAGEQRDCALVVSGPEPGVALFMSGELVGVYSMSERNPEVSIEKVRQLLSGSGSLSILQRVGDRPVGRKLVESDYHILDPIIVETPAQPEPTFEAAATEMVPEHAADFAANGNHEPPEELPLPGWMTPQEPAASAEAPPAEVPVPEASLPAEAPEEPAPQPEAVEASAPEAEAAPSPPDPEISVPLPPPVPGEEEIPSWGVREAPQAATENLFASFNATPEMATAAPEQAAGNVDSSVDFETIRTDLIQIGVLWLGDKDVVHVSDLIRNTPSTVEGFVGAIEEIKNLTVEGHDPSVIRAMAREMQYHAAEFLSGA